MATSDHAACSTSTWAADWGARLRRAGILGPGADAGPRELWETHLGLKQILANFVREEARRRFATQMKEAAQVVGAGTLLDPNALTIGFARRFATYKRANLIFRDLERLRRLLVDPWRPVQIIFAGKAHPADNPGKEVLQSVYQFTRDPDSRAGWRSSRTTTCTWPICWSRAWTSGSTSRAYRSRPAGRAA